MRLASKKRNLIVAEITPDMKQRLKELNASVIQDAKTTTIIVMRANEMQNASMMEAIKLGKI